MNTSRQWMITHEWMLKSSRQTEWIDKKGTLLWLAFYCGGIGGGFYLVSLLFNNAKGMLIGWAIVALLKGTFHLLDLGKPARFWRLVTNHRSSWLSRGLIFVMLFIGFGFLQLIISYIFPGTTAEILLKTISGILALAVMGYTGLVLNHVKGVPLWNVSFLPLLFISCGVLGGFGLTSVLSLFSGNANLSVLEGISRWLLIITSLILITYLIIVYRKEAVDQQLALHQVKRGISRLILIWVILLGIVIPLIIIVNSYFMAEPNLQILIAAIASEVLSGIIVCYYILKSGIYSPLIIADQNIKYQAYHANRAKEKQWAIEK